MRAGGNGCDAVSKGENGPSFGVLKLCFLTLFAKSGTVYKFAIAKSDVNTKTCEVYLAPRFRLVDDYLVIC